jgi:hypothetical protein
MRKQLAKGFTMFILAMAVTLVAGVVSASAQARKARATVPFEFMVGEKMLPAGDYLVGSITQSGDTIRVSSTETATGVSRLTIPADGTSRTAKLVLHRYGQQYFLAQVWTGADAEGRQFMKSRQERAIEKEDARLAALRHQPPQRTYETVEIATTLK